jgi:hypothetical protein
MLKDKQILTRAFSWETEIQTWREIESWILFYVLETPHELLHLDKLSLVQ